MRGDIKAKPCHIPTILFQGYEVREEVFKMGREIDADTVSDILDAIVSLIRKDCRKQTHPSNE